MTPSVTQILGLFQDFSRVPPDRLREAQERGTAVHAICAARLQGLWVPSIPDHLQGYIESFEQWVPFVEQIFMVEQRLHHPLGYTGQMDLLACIRGDRSPAVIDFKTPLTSNPIWRAQLSAYYRLVADTTEYKPSRTLSVRLKKDGKPPAIDAYDFNPRDFAAFIQALNAYKYFKGEK